MKPLRSFTRQEPRRTRNVLIIALTLLSLWILSLMKAHYCPSTIVESRVTFKLEVPMKANLKMITDKNDEDEGGNQMTEMDKPLCYEINRRSDTCDAKGRIRVQTSSNTIFIYPSSTHQELKIRPYARKGDNVAQVHVKEWLLKPLNDSQQLPKCNKIHENPAVIFSLGGYAGNVFNDFTDVLIPLFIISHQFHGKVQFLVSDFQDWWVDKYVLIFKQLSNHEIINVDDNEDVHCFPRVILGPSFHKELGVDPSKCPNGCSMMDFKGLLRRSFGLQRETVSTTQDQGSIRRPRLLILSRKNSRAFVNERGMVSMAISLGFDVRVGEPDVSLEISKFARLVNSADVMISAYGSGLTNMLFLPEGAVLIQVIPFGGLEWLARGSFKEPALEMKLKYLEHRVEERESTLIEQYPRDHTVLRDPTWVHRQGWNAVKSIYLEKQNVKPHLGRLMKTLREALTLLPHNT